jgi:3-methyladenine DNA glycosylase/8-oxoguanine DNA glycosylase
VSPLEIEVRPRAPYRLPRGSDDRTLRITGGVATRLLHVEGAPVLARAWQVRDGRMVIRAEAVEPAAVRLHAGRAGADRARRRAAAAEAERPQAGGDELEIAVERMRFVLGVDYDLGEFHQRFRRDPLLGPLIRRMPSFRPRLRVWPWEALAAAVVGQLIEAQRAVGIERRIVGRWGARLGAGRAQLRDVPGAATLAGRAPAELESMDLSPNRALALWRVARAVAAGRCPIETPAADRRLLTMPQIGPWTVQCLQLFGRGEMDALPAGDLGYIKLVGRLAGLGRRATVPEVEEFYAPYEPYRGLVGSLTLAGLYRTVSQGPPLRLAA